MMAFMAGERIRVIDGQNIVGLVGNDNHLCTRLEALFRALRVGFPLGAALRVRNVAIDSGGIGGERNANEDEHHGDRKAEKQQVPHSDKSSSYAAMPQAWFQDRPNYITTRAGGC